jgi:hypothetical protein
VQLGGPNPDVADLWQATDAEGVEYLQRLRDPAAAVLARIHP